MDSAKLGDWIQIIGIFAVVASLVFVGLQLKQSQEIAVAAQYHNRAALAIEINSSQLESGNLKMWGFLTGRVGDGLIPTQLREEQASWSAEQWGAHLISGFQNVIQFDNHYYQYQSGFMDEESWQAYRRFLKFQLSMPDSPVNVAMATFGDNYRESFLLLCDQLRAEIRSESGDPIIND